MRPFRKLHVTTRETWRRWLAANHETETEVWLVYAKKHTGRPRISYEEAVEEALCFGWIDSTVRRLDEERYAQKFTPRRAGSQWSALNVRRAKKLIREGRMTGAGLAKFDPKAPAAHAAPRRGGTGIPAFVKRALEDKPRARENFGKLPPSHRRRYVRWITEAKKEETRQRRLVEAVALLERNLKLGMK